MGCIVSGCGYGLETEGEKDCLDGKVIDCGHLVAELLPMYFAAQ